MRGDHARAAPNAFELARLAREHDLPMWRAFGVFLEGWATAAERRARQRARGHAPRRRAAARTERPVVRRAIEDRAGRGRSAGGRSRPRRRDPRRSAGDVRPHWAIAHSKRSCIAARGEILLKRDPANPAPAEEAFLTAIAVAKQQGDAQLRTARGAVARQALPIDRPPRRRPRRPRARARRLFADAGDAGDRRGAGAARGARARRDEVKAEAAQRQRLTQLHVAYGNALIAARGYGAPETTEAFARARESAYGDKDAPERLAADYGLWVGSYVRGDLPSMRTHAATFLADVAAMPDSPEAGVAHRVLGTTHWFAGEYAEAREHLERALTLFQPGRDDDLAFRFGQDAGVAAMCYLAIASWPLGDVSRAVSLVDGAHERLAGVTHIGTHPLRNYTRRCSN